METLQYSIGVGKYNNSLLLSRKGRNRVNSPKPIVFRQALCFSSIRFKNFPSSSLNFSNLRCSVVAADHGHHHHHEEDHNHDRHHHHHHHCGDCGGDSSELAAAQKAVLRFAKAVKWTDLANFLREHLYMCCGSTALLLAAAVCPHLLPKTVAKPLQNAFILVAFPLVGVSAALDALIDISGGKVNIHVLMALAAFASVFMGNALEGGLLLAMFNLAHIAEEYFTSRSMIDVKELKENHPESALVLDMNEDRLPNTTDLAYKRVLVHNIEVGSYVLVRAGEAHKTLENQMSFLLEERGIFVLKKWKRS